MSEAPTVKFFAVALSALQNDSVFRVTPGVVLAVSREHAQDQAMKTALEMMPESQGWTLHQAALAEVPNELDLEGWRLSWHAEGTGNSGSEVGNE